MLAVEATPIDIRINFRSAVQTHGVKSTETKSTAEEEVVIGTTCLAHGADVVAAGVWKFLHCFADLFPFEPTSPPHHTSPSPPQAPQK